MTPKTPTLKKLPLKEKDVKKQIKDYLRLRGIFYFCPLQGLGATPGVSDFIGIYKSRFLAIEAKAPKGIASEHQENFLANVRTQGGIGIVAWSVDDVIRELRVERGVL